MHRYIRYVWAGRGWQLPIWLVGIALLVVFRSGPVGLTVVGAGLIVATVVPWPWGAPAYRRRLRRALSDFARTARRADERWRDRQVGHLNSLRNVKVPPEIGSEWGELVAALDSAQSLRDSPMSLSRRAGKAVEGRLHREELQSKIASKARTDDGRLSNEALVSTLEARTHDRQERDRELDLAFSRLMLRQAELRAPDRLLPSDEQLQAVLRDQFGSMARLRTALLGRDLDEVHAAAEAYERAASARSALLIALGVAPSGSATTA